MDIYVCEWPSLIAGGGFKCSMYSSVQHIQVSTNIEVSAIANIVDECT